MGGLFRKLLIYICKPIYCLIVYTYKIFYSIASTRFLKDDLIQQFSSNIYVLVSAVMLFAFSITILSAIVNPDLLTDNKKGVAALFKRSIIALVLMVLVPFAFNQLYAIQDSIMSHSLIEKIVVGINYDCDRSSDSKCEAGGNGGQVIAGTLISSVLYPAETADGSDISVDAEDTDMSENYKKMVSEDIRYIGKVAKDINNTVDDSTKLHYDFDDDAYAYHFDGLIALVAGLITVYILIIYSIDVAVRVFKLAFLELTAPISIVAYVGVGDKILSSWFKELGKTYGELFVRIVAIAFYLFLIHNLDAFMSEFTSGDWISVLKVFLIIGMLIFVKQVPDMLGRIFVVDIKSKGGIGGRLGEMAAVGKQAQAAWGGIKQAAKLGAGVAGLGLAAAANPFAAAGVGLAHHAWNKGFKFKSLSARPGKETATGKFLTAGRKTAGSYLRGKGLVSGLNDAKKSYSESDFGIEHIANKNYNKDKKETEKFNAKMGNNSDGMVEDSELARDKFTTNSKKDLGRTRGDAVNALLDADIRKAKLEKITSDKDAIVSNLDVMRANAKTVEAQNAISDLKNGLLTGKYTADVFRQRMNGLIERGIINGSDGGTISAKLDSIQNKIASDSEISKYLLDKDNKLNFGASGLGKATDIAKTKAEAAKSTYDNLYKGSTESDKQEMDRYMAQSEKIVTKSVEQAQGEEKISHKEDIHYDIQNQTINSTDSATSNNESTPIQETINRAANVHDAPTREEHMRIQDEYNSLFNSDVGARYLDANEREDDRIHGTGNANAGSTAGSATAGAAMGSSTGSSSVQVEGLDDLFNNLNKTITSNSDNTNKILEDQLNEQKSMNNELKNQTNSINNVDSKLSGLRNDINNNLNDIKKSFDDSNTNSGE